MPTTLTIEQMDETIAIFMELPSRNEEWRKPYPTLAFIHENISYPVHALKYHSSWDWLMNAWRKLREHIYNHFNEYPWEFCNISDAWEYYCFLVDIEGAHDVLYKAIQWYNKKKADGIDGV